MAHTTASNAVDHCSPVVLRRNVTRTSPCPTGSTATTSDVRCTCSRRGPVTASRYQRSYTSWVSACSTAA
nr:hypothetical protein [Tsukamurella sp. PLM1]